MGVNKKINQWVQSNQWSRVMCYKPLPHCAFAVGLMRSLPPFLSFHPPINHLRWLKGSMTYKHYPYYIILHYITEILVLIHSSISSRQLPLLSTYTTYPLKIEYTHTPNTMFRRPLTLVILVLAILFAVASVCIFIQSVYSLLNS